MATLKDTEVFNTSTTLLSANSNVQYEISDIWIHNLAAAPIVFSLFIDRENNGTLVRKMNHTISEDDTLILSFEGTFSLDNFNVLIGQCSAATGVSITLMGEETKR